MTLKSCLVRVAFVCLSVFFVTSSRAQDAVVSDLFYDDSGDGAFVPDVHADFIEKPDVSNLEPLENLKTCTYAIVSTFIKDTGEGGEKRPGGSMYSSHYALMNRVIPEESRSQQFKPAEYGGRPISLRYWYSVIYNPPAASLANPDAAPRLTRVRPVAIPRTVWEKYKGNSRGSVLWIEAKISKTGGLMEFEFSRAPDWVEPIKEVIEKALDDWRFAPARKNGEPVVGSLRFPICIEPGGWVSEVKLPTAGQGENDSDREALTQDITVTDLQLPVVRSLADTPPAFIHPPTVQSGDAVDGMETYAYALVSQYVDETGAISERTCMVSATHQEMKKVLPKDYAKLVFQPPLRQGKAASCVGAWYAVIYNPPGASREKADAAPRLTAVCPVHVYGQDGVALKGKDPVIWCSVAVNKKGVIGKITLEPEYKYAEIIRSSLVESFKSWRFEPALANGKPVDAHGETACLSQRARLPVAASAPPNIACLSGAKSQSFDMRVARGVCAQDFAVKVIQHREQHERAVAWYPVTSPF